MLSARRLIERVPVPRPALAGRRRRCFRHGCSVDLAGCRRWDTPAASVRPVGYADLSGPVYLGVAQSIADPAEHGIEVLPHLRTHAISNPLDVCIGSRSGDCKPRTSLRRARWPVKTAVFVRPTPKVSLSVTFVPSLRTLAAGPRQSQDRPTGVHCRPHPLPQYAVSLYSHPRRT